MSRSALPGRDCGSVIAQSVHAVQVWELCSSIWACALLDALTPQVWNRLHAALHAELQSAGKAPSSPEDFERRAPLRTDPGHVKYLSAAVQAPLVGLPGMLHSGAVSLHLRTCGRLGRTWPPCCFQIHLPAVGRSA